MAVYSNAEAKSELESSVLDLWFIPEVGSNLASRPLFSSSPVFGTPASVLYLALLNP
jgi:hypothetical protein